MKGENLVNNSGKRLNILKKQNNLTNEKIGEWFGISGQSVQKWIEQGIPRRRINELAKKFGVSPRWLLVGEGSYEEEKTDDMIQKRKEIAVRLVEERAKRNLTQFDMAQKTGYSIKAIQGFEFGEMEITNDFTVSISMQGLI